MIARCCLHVSVGHVEDWLGNLEVGMKRTVKVRSIDDLAASVLCPCSCCLLQDLCETTAGQSGTMGLADMVTHSTAQMALLCLQLSWTAAVEGALETGKAQKTAMTDVNKQQLVLLAELSSWCLTDLGTDMNRCVAMWSCEAGLLSSCSPVCLPLQHEVGDAGDGTGASTGRVCGHRAAVQGEARPGNGS